jgi:diguanylate cyclase (GGDEF)-like protein
MYSDLDMKKLIKFTKTLKVLYVEDNVDASNALESLLKIFDNIVLAYNGVDGLEKFRTSSFDLVITDIRMPKMSGTEMIRNMREINNAIPVIVSTAHQEQELLMECIELGVNGYLLKPINHKKLTNAIHCVCGKLYYLYQNRRYEESLEELVKERTQELEASQKQLNLLVNRDPLTNLYNRRYFNDISQTLFNLASRDRDGLSLLMIDMDRFKVVNDSYGHLVGDMVLKELADVLLKTTRSSDVIIRFGGEEFLILLPHTHLNGAKKIAQKIRENVKNLEINIEDNIDKIVKFTVSIGVTECYCGDDKEVDTIVHRADEAMYEAKNNGRDKIIIYQKSM